jgi:hypothetical protein
MWKLWKTQWSSTSAKGIATIPVPGEKSSSQIHAVSAIADYREPVG